MKRDRVRVYERSDGGECTIGLLDFATQPTARDVSASVGWIWPRVTLTAPRAFANSGVSKSTRFTSAGLSRERAELISAHHGDNEANYWRKRSKIFSACLERALDGERTDER
jgi:hypothetical protein